MGYVSNAHLNHAVLIQRYIFIAHTVRDKFYRTDTFDIDAEIVNETRKKLVTLHPQEKYRIPITENQRLRHFFTMIM